MSESTQTRRAFWKGLLVLLLAPVAVVGVFAAYVHLANRVAQPGPLAVSTWPETVLPWQDAHYIMTVRPPVSGEAPAIEAMDMAFLVDMSGSMRASAPAMAAAVANAVDLISRSAGGQVRFALVRFDTDAETLVDWT